MRRSTRRDDEQPQVAALRGRPLLAKRQLVDPSLDVNTIECLSAQTEDTRHIRNLARRAPFLGPLQLRDDRVLGRSCRHVHVHDALRGPAPERFGREWPILPDHETDLPRAVHIDDVEHRPPPQGVACDVRVDVERIHVDAREKPFERLRRRVDHDVEIVRGSRLAVHHARERADDHVRDLRIFEKLGNRSQNAGDAAHGSINGAFGHARLKVRRRPTCGIVPTVQWTRRTRDAGSEWQPAP